MEEDLPPVTRIRPSLFGSAFVMVPILAAGFALIVADTRLSQMAGLFVTPWVIVFYWLLRLEVQLTDEGEAILTLKLFFAELWQGRVGVDDVQVEGSYTSGSGDGGASYYERFFVCDAAGKKRPMCPFPVQLIFDQRKVFDAIVTVGSWGPTRGQVEP